MRSDVVVPGRMMSGPSRGGDHQPGILRVREPGHGRLPLLAGLGPDCGQVQQVLALELVAGPSVPAHRDPVEGASHSIRGWYACAAGPARRFLKAHHVRLLLARLAAVMLATPQRGRCRTALATHARTKW